MMEGGGIVILKVSQADPVTVFRMGRNVGKWVFYYVHSFVLGEILIDSSTIYVADELTGALRGRDISSIINTHHHEDHTGNNQLLQQMLDIKIYAHPAALPFMANPETRQPLYIKICWSCPEPSTALPLGDSISIGTYTLQVIHTPGHSPDHICLYESQHKLLFTGDLFCGERVKYLRADEDFKLLLHSLKKLENLEVETIFCAVSGVISDGKLALKNKIAFMESLQARVEELYQQGFSPTRIRKELLGREGFMYYASGGHFAKQNMINSILGLS